MIRVVQASLFGLILYYAAFSYIIPQVLSDDAWMGLQVGKISHESGNFNEATKVDPSNITNDIGEFQSWFSPGQYVIPGLIASFFSASTGKAVWLMILLCILSGTLGLYRFYVSFGYTPGISLTAVFLMTLHFFVASSVARFEGADILLFGFVPWYLHYLVNIKRGDVKSPVVLGALGLAGFFMKSSFLIVLASSVAGLIAVRAYQDKDKGEVIRHAIPLITAVAVVVLLSYFFYIRLGDNPANPTQLAFYWSDLLTPLCAIITSAFSIDVGLDIFFGEPMHFSYMGRKVAEELLLLYVLLAIVCLWLIFSLINRREQRVQVIFSFVVWAVYFLVFFLLYVTNGEGVSTESRHYFVVGLLFLPLILQTINEISSRWLRVLIYFIIVGNVVYTQYSVIDYKLRVNQEFTQLSAGLLIENFNQDALTEMHRIDNQSGLSNKLMIVPAQGLSLDIKNYRTMTIPLHWMSDEDLKSLPYYSGTTDDLLIVLPKSKFEQGLQEEIKQHFISYSSYELVSEKGGYYFIRLLKK